MMLKKWKWRWTRKSKLVRVVMPRTAAMTLMKSVIAKHPERCAKNARMKIEGKTYFVVADDSQSPWRKKTEQKI